MALQKLIDKTVHQLIEDDGTFPNNGLLPLLAYQGLLELPAGDQARGVEELFHANDWGGSWRNGVFGYHHYHSTAHEALGVYGGQARVQLGGPAQGRYSRCAGAMSSLSRPVWPTRIWVPPPISGWWELIRSVSDTI